MASPKTPPPKVFVSQRLATWRTEPPKAAAPKPRRATSVAAHRAAFTEHARAAAGVTGQTVPLWTPGDWLPLQFPLDQPEAALAFVTGAFRHGGWPLLDDFVGDLDGAYRGLRPSQRETIPSGPLMKTGAAQMRAATCRLRPRVADALMAIEQQAVEELRRRVDAATSSALAQARALLVMPVRGGQALAPESLLAMRFNPPDELKRSPPAIRSGEPDGQCLKSQLLALLPKATELASWDRTKDLQDALDAMMKVLRASTMVTDTTRPLLAGAETAEATIVAVRKSGQVAEQLQGVLSSHADVLEAWRQAQAGFVAARRAAADRLPVLYRFGFSDVVEAAAEDDGALGWRVSGVLANVFAGAIEVRQRYVDGIPAYPKPRRPKRPAQRLTHAMKREPPPADPVRYVMAMAEESVWAHDGLIQAAMGVLSQSPASGGPFSLLDSFPASVAEQALAEGARQRQRETVKEVAKGLGLGAALVLIHLVAPPVALIIDAGFAAHDLTVSSEDLGKKTAEARCAFDESLALGPEPSLAWFLASQAFNVLTVG